MKKLLPILVITLAVAFGSTAVSAQSTKATNKPMGKMDAKQASLYKRLGGYDAIAAVSDEVLKRLAADKQLHRFFVGLSEDSLKRLRQHFVEFLCEAAGGPCIYLGRDMKTAHKGLMITKSDWDIGVKIVVSVIKDFKVAEKETNELIAAIAPLEGMIVEKPNN
jgi:hemoglobin